jgi:hypothetical protein
VFATQRLWGLAANTGAGHSICTAIAIALSRGLLAPFCNILSPVHSRFRAFYADISVEINRRVTPIPKLLKILALYRVRPHEIRRRRALDKSARDCLLKAGALASRHRIDSARNFFPASAVALWIRD